MRHIEIIDQHGHRHEVPLCHLPGFVAEDIAERRTQMEQETAEKARREEIARQQEQVRQEAAAKAADAINQPFDLTVPAVW